MASRLSEQTCVGAITGFLDGVRVPYDLVEHERVTSAAAEARVANLPLERVAKTVVLQDEGVYVIAAIPAHRTIAMGKLRELLGARRNLRLASVADIARDFPMVEAGTVPPVGAMVPAAEVIDSALLAQQLVLCPAGDCRHSVLLEPEDIVRVTAATVADISDG